jgi:glycosyltransferase involved in cell wall biosynthesis
MTGKEKVQILLSSYQGEQFLEEQLDSLLKQSWKNLEILIRDDGSTDGTRKILEDYSAKYEHIKYFPGENIGVTQSFFELLKKSDAAYVAFCDQDDIWLERKVEAAVRKLTKETGPALYCGNKILVDRSLSPMKKQSRPSLKPGFGNAVVECICTGCTAVMNRELADILAARLPEYAILHDWWTYLAASYTGKVIFDPNPYILYRQHEGNVVGAKGGFWGEVQSKAAYLKKSRGKLKRQLSEFGRLYQGDRKKDRLVRQILAAEHFPGRLQIICNRKMYRQSALDEIIMRILFLINRML